MRLRNENQKTGHLLTFISKEKRENNFSFFFPVEGLEQFDSLLKVIKGFEHCFESLKEEYKFVGYSVADVGCVEEIFPEIDKNRMLRFELDEFLDENSQFIEDFARIIVKRRMKREDQIFPDIRAVGVVTGLDFYGRREKLEEIWENLQKGKNLLLRAPRRYGKTSLLDHISKNPLLGWRICYVDLEGGKSSEDFIEQILKGLIQRKECNFCLPKHISTLGLWKESEGRKLDIVREERNKFRENWQEYGEAIFASMNSAEDHFVLILDEFSFLLEDMISFKGQNTHKVNELMEWFHKIRKKMNRLHFILSGSEHLPTFLNFYGIDGHIDDLETIHLDLFNRQVAREFIFLALAGKKIVVQTVEIDQILALIGEPIPHFLQLFLDNLNRICREQQSLSSNQIEAAYHQELLGSGSKRYFESIQRQLDRYNRYGERSRAGAESILDKLAVNDFVDRNDLEVIWQGVTDSKERFEVMLSVLQDDFYIREDGGKFFFASKLLKDWWERHGLAGKR